MPNVIIQDLTAVINGTSRQGAGYDTIHVETFIQTGSPIPLDSFYYVPNESSVPNKVLALFKLENLICIQCRNQPFFKVQKILEKFRQVSI